MIRQYTRAESHSTTNLLNNKEKKSYFAIMTSMAVMLMLMAWLSLSIDDISSWPLAVLCNFSTIIAISVVISTIYTAKRGIWSASAIYLIVFCLFHCGLTFVYGVGLPIGDYIKTHVDFWFFGTHTPKAIILSSIAVLACSFGIHCGLLRQKNYQLIDSKNDPIRSILVFFGIGITLISILAWFAIAINTGGMGVLSGSYMEFLDSTEGTGIPYAYFGMSLGMVLLGSSPQCHARTIGFIVFGCWALLALSLGLRTEALVPGFLAGVQIAKSRPFFTLGKTLVLGVALLALIAVVRQVREVGVDDAGTEHLKGSPFDGLAEMGGSLRPVTLFLDWEADGDPLIYGASYWAPIERAMQLVVPFGVRLDAKDDYRLLNVLMMERAGPYGLSPVAEAYRNFGVAGVVFAMLLTGLLLGIADSWPPAEIHQVVVGIILAIVFLQVRNAFTPVPAQLVVGLLIVGAIVLICKSLITGQSQPKLFNA